LCISAHIKGVTFTLDMAFIFAQQTKKIQLFHNNV